MSTSWEEFEEHVRNIYSMLLNLKDENVTVARDVLLTGRDGLVHQFDVYYQFSRAGVNHRVAIECKNRARPVDKDAVMAFRSKVNDVLGLQGIIIAANGFQSGAKKYAENNGILAVPLEELPKTVMLMEERLEYMALPDEKAVGEPFWSLYYVENGQITGTFYSSEQAGDLCVLLFFSKRHASRYLDALPQETRDQYVVRGLPQGSLRSFILTTDCFRSNFLLVFEPDSRSHSAPALKISRKALIEQYYLGSAPIPDEPMVMPDLENWRHNCKNRDLGPEGKRNFRGFVESLRRNADPSVDYKSFIAF